MYMYMYTYVCTIASFWSLVSTRKSIHCIIHTVLKHYVCTSCYYFPVLHFSFFILEHY